MTLTKEERLNEDLKIQYRLHLEENSNLKPHEIDQILKNQEMVEKYLTPTIVQHIIDSYGGSIGEYVDIHPYQEEMKMFEELLKTLGEKNNG